MYFEKLVEFVDIWERYLRKSILLEVMTRMEHTEEKLHAFYKHIEDRHDVIQANLAKELLPKN